MGRASPPRHEAKLFDRFHRATDMGNGAGLGLAIGDSVVRATGGEWRVGTVVVGRGPDGGPVAPLTRRPRSGRAARTGSPGSAR